MPSWAESGAASSGGTTYPIAANYGPCSAKGISRLQASYSHFLWITLLRTLVFLLIEDFRVLIYFEFFSVFLNFYFFNQ
jgi:hypothetical protein